MERFYNSLWSGCNPFSNPLVDATEIVLKGCDFGLKQQGALLTLEKAALYIKWNTDLYMGEWEEEDLPFATNRWTRVPNAPYVLLKDYWHLTVKSREANLTGRITGKSRWGQPQDELRTLSRRSDGHSVDCIAWGRAVLGSE